MMKKEHVSIASVIKKSRNGKEIGLVSGPCTKIAIKERDYHLTDL